ncbi:MAG: DMT family transporter [Rhizobiaceae bacterium]|jgi:O-acetylserine/cysteine efflux transporter|nr:DMT family transporter [Rhizobiaceae bacterium]
MSPKDVGLAFGVTAAWGAGLTFAKATMVQFPPVFLMAVALWATALVMAIRERGTPTTSHPRAALIALFAVSLQSALIFKGLSGLEASVGGLLSQVQVPMAIFAAWALATEPVRLAKLIPIGIAFIGVAIIIGLPDDTPPVLPTLTMLAGTAAWGIGQAMIARYARDGSDLLLKRTSLHGAIQLTAMTLLFESGQWNAVMTAEPIHWAGLAYNTIIGFVIAYVIWYGLLKRNPVSSVSPFIMVIPVVTLLTALIFLGDTIEPVEWAGGALIMIGVAMSAGILPSPGILAKSVG